MNAEKFAVMKYLLEKSESVSYIARELRVDRKTINMWKLRSSAQRATRRFSKGAVRSITKRREQVRALVRTKKMLRRTRFTPVRREAKTRYISRHPYDSVAKICRGLATVYNVNVSISTVRNDLQALGYVARCRGLAPFLSREDMTLRVEFCKQMLSDVPQVCFSDESNFDSNEGGMNRFQWVLPSERPEPKRYEQNAASLTIWAAIATDFKLMFIIPSDVGRLTIAQYKEQILDKALPHLRKLSRKGVVFQQDNAPAHRGSISYLKSNRVKCIENWPARSCDLNVIEGLWKLVKEKVAARGPFGEELLRQYITEAWEDIPISTINALIDSFPNRLRECIRIHGKTVGS